MTIDQHQPSALHLEIQGLRCAMSSRAVIEQAKGILMFVYQVDEARAFAILTRWSMQHQVKVRDLAVALIDITLHDEVLADIESGAHRAVRTSLRPPRLESVVDRA